MKQQLKNTDFNKWFSNYSEKYHHLKGWRDYDQYLDEIELPNELFHCLIQKWLREVHNIHLEISRGGHLTSFHLFISDWGYNKSSDYFYEADIVKEFKTYEQALETGLQEALRLINNGE